MLVCPPIRTLGTGATYISSPIHEIAKCIFWIIRCSEFYSSKLPRTLLYSIFGKDSLGWFAQIGKTVCWQTDIAENAFPGEFPTIMFEHFIKTYCRSAVSKEIRKQLIEQRGLSSELQPLCYTMAGWMRHCYWANLPILRIRGALCFTWLGDAGAKNILCNAWFRRDVVF